MVTLNLSSMINRFRRKRFYANLLNTVTQPLRPWFQTGRNENRAERARRTQSVSVHMAPN